MSLKASLSVLAALSLAAASASAEGTAPAAAGAHGVGGAKSMSQLRALPQKVRAAAKPLLSRVKQGRDKLVERAKSWKAQRRQEPSDTAAEAGSVANVAKALAVQPAEAAATGVDGKTLAGVGTVLFLVADGAMAQATGAPSLGEQWAQFGSLAADLVGKPALTMAITAAVSAAFWKSIGLGLTAASVVGVAAGGAYLGGIDPATAASKLTFLGNTFATAAEQGMAYAKPAGEYVRTGLGWHWGNVEASPMVHLGTGIIGAAVPGHVFNAVPATLRYGKDLITGESN